MALRLNYLLIYQSEKAQRNWKSLEIKNDDILSFTAFSKATSELIELIIPLS